MFLVVVNLQIPDLVKEALASFGRPLLPGTKWCIHDAVVTHGLNHKVWPNDWSLEIDLVARLDSCKQFIFRIFLIPLRLVKVGLD